MLEILSAHRRARRSPLLILGLLVCGLTLAARTEATTVLDPINFSYYMRPFLEYGNGNKIAVSTGNRINAVFAHFDPVSGTSDIHYENFDPLWAAWTEYMITYNGTSYQPTLAMDSGSMNNGRAVVAWVVKPSSTTPMGGIYYSYQTLPNCTISSCWSVPQQIVAFGAEPSIAAENGVVHLTWTTGDRVQYTSFPRTSPPTSPLWLGEVVDFTNCPKTRFSRPSIALVRPPCQDLSVKIAALLTSNEQSTVGACQNAATQAGPRVYERNATTVSWSVWQDEVTTDPAPGQPDPQAYSLSFNSNRLTGDFYLAWSDAQNSAPQTWLGYGKGTNWYTALYDSQAHNVHIAAKGGGFTGHFRLATSGLGWGTAADSRTGKWSGGSQTWTGAPLPVPDSTFSFARRPQALYWSRCASSQLTERRVYSEVAQTMPSTTSIQTDIATDLSQTGPVNCFQIAVGTAIALPDCFHHLLSIGLVARPGGGNAVLVDLGDTAAVARLSSTGAEIKTLAGGTIQASWAPGDVLASWENGFVVVTSRDSVRFTSNESFRIEDLGLVDNGNKN